MSRYISTSDMSKEEWLKARLPFLGASEVSAALGLNPYRTPFDLWREKTGDPSFIPFEGNQFTIWGNRLEDSIAQGFAEDHGYKIQKDNKLRVHNNGILSCSLDRTIIGSNNGHKTPGILEIKNMSNWAYDKLLKDDNDIPIMYYSQHQQQFGITGYDWGFFVMLIGGNEMVVKEMVPDWDYIKKQETEATSWWNKYVVGKTPPDFEVKDLEDPKTTALTGDIQVATKEAFQAHSMLMTLKKRIKELTEQKTKLEKILKKEIGTAKSLEYEGSEIANWSEFQQFSSKLFKEANPDEYAKYKEVMRRFNIKEFIYENK